MSRPQSPIVCDGPGCGKQKQEANHWFVIAWQAPQHSAGRLKLYVYDYDAKTDDTFNEYICGWSWFDFCGTSCALKFISEQMGKARGENDAK